MLVNSADIFRDELNPSERIIWSGQPQQGLLLRTADAFMLPFSLLWSGIVFFGLFSALSDGAPFFFLIVGIPFILVGLYVVFGRFLIDTAQRRKTYYALTDQRVLIISGLRLQNLRALDLKKIAEINMSIKNDGRGTIIFGPPAPYMWMNSLNWFPNMGTSNIAPRFEMIEGAKMVYGQIKHLQREIA